MAVIIKNITKGDKYYRYEDLITRIELSDGGFSPDLSDASVYPDLSGIIKDIQKGNLIIFEDTLGRLGGRTSATKAVVPVTSTSPYTVAHNLGTMFPIVMAYAENSDSDSYGTSVSDTSPSTDLSGDANNRMYIWVDYDTDGPQIITVDVDNCDTGANVASEIEDAIQALGGVYEAVTCVYTSVYTLTSGTSGPGSRVIVASAPYADMAVDLKLGAYNGGTETSGVDNTFTTVSITSVKVNNANSITVTTGASADHVVIHK